MDNDPITNQLNHLEVVRKPVQMIHSNGTFHQTKVEKFVESATYLLAPGETYAVISIIGAQSSGKSFLLNQIFSTRFDVMKGSLGRSQTTQGILLARSTKPCALVMDVEGSDGRERGEDDVSFERQAALFALAVSDMMILNMWLQDIGLQNGGCIPLLRTVFQERIKLEPGKTKVLVVIRGYDYETPVKTLEQDILKTLEEIWISVHVHDRPDRIAVQFSEYIEVMVVALPDKILKQKFEEEVAKLREWFAKENIVGRRQDKNSTSGFSFSAKNIWEAIKQNKQLDLPGNKVIVSTYVCEKVANECLAAVIKDENFGRLNDAVSSDKFIVNLEGLLRHCVTRYDKDTEMSDKNQRNEKRDVLKKKFLQSAEPFANKLLHKIRSEFFREKKDEVTALLNKENDPAMKASAIVDDFLELFTRSCGGLESKYKPLCLESYNMLRTELSYYARDIALHIKAQRMTVNVERAKAEAEHSKEETKLERERYQQMVENVLMAKQEADAVRKEFYHAMQIKEQAEAAAERARQDQKNECSIL